MAFLCNSNSNSNSSNNSSLWMSNLPVSSIQTKTIKWDLAFEIIFIKTYYSKNFTKNINLFLVFNKLIYK